MLEGISIAAPCSADWESMPGTDRVRHCSQCGKNVYNLSAMTRREAEKLLRETEGSLCARLYRRNDGTILTENCPAGLRAIGTRVSRWVGAAMALCALAAPQSPLIQVASAQEQAAGHSVAGTVKDPTGAFIPGAKVIARRAGTHTEYTAVSDADGRFRMSSLPRGDYEIEISMDGFNTYRDSVFVGRFTNAKVQATMSFGLMGEVVFIKKNHHWWQL